MTAGARDSKHKYELKSERSFPELLQAAQLSHGRVNTSEWLQELLSRRVRASDAGGRHLEMFSVATVKPAYSVRTAVRLTDL